MNVDLRRQLLAVFETGSAEELSVLLALIYLLSTHTQSRNAAVDFDVRSGACKLSNEWHKADN